MTIQSGLLIKEWRTQASQPANQQAAVRFHDATTDTLSEADPKGESEYRSGRETVEVGDQTGAPIAWAHNLL